MEAAILSGGFADPPRDAAHAFRAVMQVMARPGRIEQIAGATGPAPLSPAASNVILTLCDPDTPIFLGPSRDSSAVRDWITFHTGALFAGPERAAFALGAWEELAGLPFPIGTSDYPDRSTTLIIEIDRLEPEGAELTGPGIETDAHLSLPEVAAFRRNAALSPLGLDHFFTCGDRIAGLPRSTRIAEAIRKDA